MRRASGRAALPTGISYPTNGPPGVYSLGCTLWFLLTGFPPGPASPRPDLPAGLDKILGRMLADL